VIRQQLLLLLRALSMRSMQQRGRYSGKQAFGVVLT
jgi:hypothetical protein